MSAYSMDRPARFTRRSIVRAAGVALTCGLAGCASPGGDDEDDEDDEGGGVYQHDGGGDTGDR